MAALLWGLTYPIRRAAWLIDSYVLTKPDGSPRFTREER